VIHKEGQKPSDYFNGHQAVVWVKFGVFWGSAAN
jgi:hypothetical protein